MFRREIGDEFEYQKGNKVYTLKVVSRLSKGCKGCALECETIKCDNLAGYCSGNGKEYMVVINRVKDLDKEITKSDIQDLTKAIKSIGDAFKIVEAFKQISEQQKRGEEC